jgi:YVTN family beta-propeller protein
MKAVPSKNGEKMKLRITMSVIVFGFAVLATFGAGSGYHLLKKVTVPGAGGWDYVTVDEAGRRAYIAHSTQVEVLNADTFELVGTIPNIAGAHGVAVAPEFGRGFATAGKSDAVIMFDLKTLKPLGEIKVGKKPDAIIYDPGTKHVFAMNGDSDDTTVINAADGKVIGTIALGGGPEFAAADGKGNLYVNIEEKGDTVHVDLNSMKAVHSWPLAPCATPTAMAFDPAARRLFVGCRGGKMMAVVDADSGKVVTTSPIGERVDAGAYDPATKLVFMSTGDGIVSIFHQDSADKYSLVENLATAPGAKTMGLDPKTHNLFVPSNQGGTFTILVFGK